MLAVSQENELYQHVDFSSRYFTGHVGRLQLPVGSSSLTEEEQGGGGDERGGGEGRRGAREKVGGLDNLWAGGLQ